MKIGVLVKYEKELDIPKIETKKDWKLYVIFITNDPEKKSKEYCYILYNKKKEICLLNSSEIFQAYPKQILNALFSGLDKDTLLWISVDIAQENFMENIVNYAKNGFNSPYVTNMSPLPVNISPSIAFVRQNIPTEKYDETQTLNKVLYALKEYKKENKSCSLFAKLSKKAVSFLRKTSKIGVNKENAQKELGGELYVTNVIKKDGEFIYVIDVNEESVESGEEENIDIDATRYNFHSHPEQAYIRHGVDKAWPSLTDYLGYLQLGNSTIFHCVATLEGAYIISFSSYWGNRLKKIDKNFIKRNYNIDHKENYTPEKYVKKVNTIKFKKEPIYKVLFMPWDQAHKPFHVSFAKIGLACIATQKGMDYHEKLHSPEIV